MARLPRARDWPAVAGAVRRGSGLIRPGSGVLAAAKPLLRNLRKAFPAIKLTWADGGYTGKLVTWAAARLKPKLTLEIVKRPDDLHTFQVLPRRRVVERTLSWITRHRRTVRDYERQAAPPRDLHPPGHDPSS